MSDKLAKIRPYYKSEIARLYRKSRRVILSWINEIIDELEDVGYKETQQIFTLKQVEMIFEYLGHPPAIYKNEVFNEEDDERVLLVPYSKQELAKIYEISVRTLITQINAIPSKKVRALIMDGLGDRNVYKENKKKRFFKKNEVELVFKYLGHPYKDKKNEQ